MSVKGTLGRDGVVTRTLGACGGLLPTYAYGAELAALAADAGLIAAGGLLGAGVGAWIMHRRSVRNSHSEGDHAARAAQARANAGALVDPEELEVRLARLFDSVHDEACQHILLSIAFDGVAAIEDACGAAAGDELSQNLIALLGSKMRRNDTLARTGTDQFAALLPLCPLDQGLRIANGIREAARDYRFEWQGRAFMLAASIGLVPLDGPSGDVAAVLSAAERTLSEAKRRGGDHVHVSRPGAEAGRTDGDSKVLALLGNGFEQGDFMLYQQPIRPLKAAVSSPHFEILVRLRGERGTLLQPAAFMPVAARYNLLTTIDRWVVVELLKVLAARRHGRDSHMAPEAGLYSLNLSGASINDSSFPDFLRSQIAHYAVPPSLLCFEITETVAISNLAKAADLMHELKALGCRFALDDFGIGMSSFAYLKYLPVDFLKIDGIFVKDMHLDEMDYAIVEALNRIAHTLGMQTVAEVVEQRATVELLTALGVDYAQGNHIGEPEPLAGTQPGLDASRMTG